VVRVKCHQHCHETVTCESSSSWWSVGANVSEVRRVRATYSASDKIAPCIVFHYYWWRSTTVQFTAQQQQQQQQPLWFAARWMSMPTGATVISRSLQPVELGVTRLQWRHDDDVTTHRCCWDDVSGACRKQRCGRGTDSGSTTSPAVFTIAACDVHDFHADYYIAARLCNLRHRLVTINNLMRQNMAKNQTRTRLVM